MILVDIHTGTLTQTNIQAQVYIILTHKMTHIQTEEKDKKIKTEQDKIKFAQRDRQGERDLDYRSV